MGRVLFLTGFMGTGKSAVGRLVARRLGWSFVDLDDVVEAAAGKPVHRIFAEDGEDRFRDLEARALERAAALDRAVVATGGGVLGRLGNRRLLAGRLVVNLRADPDTCVRRISVGGPRRPLLEADDPARAARELYAARRALYDGVPRQVHTDGRTPEAVADEVICRFLPAAREP